MSSQGLAYLATPYSKYPLGFDAAFEDACVLTAKLMDQGWHIYAPIVYGHPLSGHLQKGKDQDFWYVHNNFMLQRSEILLVGGLLGWDRSAGIKQEIIDFKDLGRPIFFVEPVTLKIAEYSTAAENAI